MRIAGRRSFGSGGLFYLGHPMRFCILQTISHMVRRVMRCESLRMTNRAVRGQQDDRAGGLMAARLDSVARFICEHSGWSVSNLQLQKLLYLAQMINLGRTGGVPLFEGSFQAWDYGPVEPSLYHRAKAYGSGPLPDIFHDARSFANHDPRKKVLEDVCSRFLKYTPGELVDITHWDRGAWAKHYVPKSRSIPIPKESILEEYRARNPN